MYASCIGVCVHTQTCAEDRGWRQEFHSTPLFSLGSHWIWSQDLGQQILGPLMSPVSTFPFHWVTGTFRNQPGFQEFELSSSCLHSQHSYWIIYQSNFLRILKIVNPKMIIYKITYVWLAISNMHKWMVVFRDTLCYKSVQYLQRETGNVPIYMVPVIGGFFPACQFSNNHSEA